MQRVVKSLKPTAEGDPISDEDVEKISTASLVSKLGFHWHRKRKATLKRISINC